MDKTITRCWKCGADNIEVLLPLARNEECPECRADLHVCRMCRFYDTSVGNDCREPVADFVSDKTRANFCGYLELLAPDANAQSGSAHGTGDELQALFGLDGAPEASPTEPDAARASLDDLFGLDDDSKNDG